MIIGYANANIDLLVGSTVFNLSDIYRYPIVGNKTINEIYFLDNLAYLSCGFGIVVLDIERREIKDTYYIGNNSGMVNVKEITIHDDTIFAATETGIYYASLNGGNLADYNNWTFVTEMGEADYSTIASFKDYVFVNKNNSEYQADSLFYYDNGSWQYWNVGFPIGVYDLNASDDHLMIATEGAAYFYNSPDSVDFLIYTLGSTSIQPSEVITDEDGIYWTADRRNGLIRSRSPWNHDIIYPNGPSNTQAFSMANYDDRVIVASGGRSDTWNSTWSRAGFHVYENDIWRSQSLSTLPGAENDTLWDAVAITIDPADKNHFFISSWGRGLIEMRNNEAVNIFREHNSLISPAEVSYYDVRVGGIMFDRNSNLWVANSQNSNFIVLKTADNNWFEYSFNNEVGKNHLAGELIASRYHNYIFVQLGRGGGILAFDYGGTFDDTSDDSFIKLTSAIGSGGLPTNEVNAIAEDKDGELWVGTTGGIAVFYDTPSLFTSTPQDAQQILVNFQGHWQNLLEAEEVLDIYVDGGNRKWIATAGSGVFLLSEDGTEEIYHFTKDNSPLFSDRVNSITINEKSGEVFFGTDKGIVSFRGDATLGEENFEGTYAFPNPVKPGYTGLITITGLVENAIVKITDISGNAIYETQANGGTATWDGNSISGDRAASGIYLIFATDENGEQSVATKLLFIN